jgi:hypothetical protein
MILDEMYSLKDDVMLNPGLSALWNDERKRRKTLNLDGTITPPESQGSFFSLIQKKFKWLLLIF